jgi:hypothetical protein
MEAATLARGTVRRPGAPSWLRVAGCVIAASVAALAVLLVAQALLAALGLLPGNVAEVPGRGWPWRIDGWWAALADLGPLLAAGFLFSAVVFVYLGLATGVRARRWPLALLAGAIGFVPVGSPDPGYLVVSGWLAFIAVVLLTRHEALRARRPIRWSPALAAIAAAGTVAVTATSLSYGLLNPLTLTMPDGVGPSVNLRDGRSKELAFMLENRGAVSARVLAVSLVEGGPIGVLRAEADLPDGVVVPSDAPARPLAGTRVAPRGGMSWGSLTLGSAACSGRGGGSVSAWPVSALDVRLRVAGTVHTQRLRLSPPWRVGCAP